MDFDSKNNFSPKEKRGEITSNKNPVLKRERDFLLCSGYKCFIILLLGGDGMKRRILLAIAGIVSLLVIGVSTFWYFHPTYFAYNDRFVLGSTKAQIQERYGAFYSEGTKICTYMIRDDTPELIMGYDNSLWYEIYFENGIAVSVDLRKGYLGG